MGFLCRCIEEGRGRLETRGGEKEKDELPAKTGAPWTCKVTLVDL